MSQPVKLSDEIVDDARRIAKVAERSIAGQIEFWTKLGRAIEPLLDGARSLALRGGGVPSPLSECLGSVDSDQGRPRVKAYLNSQPFPHYEPVSDAPDLLMRIDEDGSRTLGRFVGRVFQAVK